MDAYNYKGAYPKKQFLEIGISKCLKLRRGSHKIGRLTFENEKTERLKKVKRSVFKHQFLIQPLSFKRTLYTKIIRDKNQCVADSGYLNNNLKELESKLSNLNEIHHQKIRTGYLQKHTTWLIEDRSRVIVYVNQNIIGPLLNLRLILEKKRLYLYLFQVYAKIKYPLNERVSLFEIKHSYEFGARQLKKRYKYLRRVDRFFQLLFYSLRPIFESYVYEILYVIFVKKIVACFISVYIVGTVLPSFFNICVQTVLNILNIFPFYLKESVFKVFSTLFISLPKFFTMGILVAFGFQLYINRKASILTIVQCALIFWSRFFSLFLICWIFIKHPILFVALQQILFLFKAPSLSAELY
jgi:hypothetical protein